MAEATVTMEDTGGGTRATLSGDFRVAGVEALRDQFKSIGGAGRSNTSPGPGSRAVALRDLISDRSRTRG